MKMIAIFAVWSLAASACLAQSVTLGDAKEEIAAAKAELDKVVAFCRHCRAAGTIEGKPCTFCAGQGVLLKSEQESVQHKIHLERRAERAGVARNRYAEFDVAKRLSALKENIESEALEMLTGYVAYVKAYRKHKKLIEEDERFAEKSGSIIKLLDALIAKHAPRLNVASLKMLYEDEPAGKVGAFSLHGRVGKVRIDGKEIRCLKMRTLKEYSVLIVNGQVQKRDGYIVAEIIGKQTYKTDDGQEIRGILMQAY